MEIVATLIIGLLGGGGFVTLIQFFVKRHDSKNDNLADIRTSLAKLEQKSAERDVEISKLLLSNLIQHNPKEHQPILYEARHYFVNLGADSWMFDKISKWAEEEKVDIGWINEIENKKVKEATWETLSPQKNC